MNDLYKKRSADPYFGASFAWKALMFNQVLSGDCPDSNLVSSAKQKSSLGIFISSSMNSNTINRFALSDS